MQRWLKMGVELEGGWDEVPEDVASRVNGASYHSDGSVRIDSDDAEHSGEIVTAPHADLNKLCRDIEVLHPHFVNNTCGMHIHASFVTWDYTLLTSTEFQKYFLARWEAWGKRMAIPERSQFWRRLHGDNEYCTKDFTPRDQLNGRGGRYTQLNFSAFQKHGTLECRLLPAFADVSMSVSAICEMANIYDSYLNTIAKSIGLAKWAPLEISDEGVLTETREVMGVNEDGTYVDIEVSGTSETIAGDDVFYHFDVLGGMNLPFQGDGGRGE